MVGPIIFEVVSVTDNELILLHISDGKMMKFKRISPPSEMDSRPEISRPKIAGFAAEFSNFKYFLGTMSEEVLNCPRESCDDYEEEAAKILISYLLAKKSGEWLEGFIKWENVKEFLSSGLDDLSKMAILVAEAEIRKIIEKIKNKIEKSKRPRPCQFLFAN